MRVNFVIVLGPEGQPEKVVRSGGEKGPCAKTAWRARVLL
jgi:hypothetical protein